ncbi:MAG: hypothetical protein ACRC2T_05175 [Thermoguttaceae bacterium]
MKITIVQTILQIEWPDNQQQATPSSSPAPNKPERMMRHELIDEDAYFRAIEMWEMEGGYV